MRKPSAERERAQERESERGRERERESKREIHLVNLLRGVPVKLHMAQSGNSRQPGKGGREREREMAIERDGERKT